MRHISAGTTWLEAIGLAHCDIRPANVFLDSQNNAKLADFDRSIKVGDDLDSGTAPFARLLGKEEGLGRGTYGKAGRNGLASITGAYSSTCFKACNCPRLPTR
jgi:serine/threonine protein kinase